MTSVVDGFDWDAGNRAKCQEHGVSAAAIEGMFSGPIAILPDPEHSIRDANEGDRIYNRRAGSIPDIHGAPAR